MVARSHGGWLAPGARQGAAARQVAARRRARRRCARGSGAVPAAARRRRLPGGGPRGLRRLARTPRCTPRRARSAPRRSTTAAATSPAASRSALERHAGRDGVAVLAADLPYVTADDVRELIAHARPLALVAAADGTTNAIAACPPAAFRPSYGPGSAARHGGTRVRLAGIERDIDTPARSRARAHRMPRVTRARRRRRRGALRARPARVRARRRRHDHRQRRRRPRALGPRDLARPRHAALHADGPHPPRAGLGRRGRHARGDGASWPSSAAADWFILGDRDIGLHLVRSERLRAGEPLSAITADFARRYGLGARLLPASDDRLRTRIVTPDGELAFQEWLVGRRAADPVQRRALRGRSRRAARARRARGDRERGRDRARALEPVRLARLRSSPSTACATRVVARREHVVAITPMIGAAGGQGPARRRCSRRSATTSRRVGVARRARRRSPRRSCSTSADDGAQRRDRARSACARSACRR